MHPVLPFQFFEAHSKRTTTRQPLGSLGQAELRGLQSSSSRNPLTPLDFLLLELREPSSKVGDSAQLLPTFRGQLISRLETKDF